MHALHPRSRTTSTLFTTTLAISFLVVALPHLLPCPADRRQFADGPGGRARRRRKVDEGDDKTIAGQLDKAQIEDDAARPARECPVPKPGGVVGQVFGFQQTRKQTPMEVIIRNERPSKSERTGADDDKT